MRTYYMVPGTLHCGGLNGDEVEKGRGIRTHTADSFCFKAETNTTL